jgi:hypothetical protein
MKPTAPSITINHKLFIKQDDRDFLTLSIYICEETQQLVKVSWSEFYQAWNVEGCFHKNFMDNHCPYYIMADSLETEMKMPEQYIDTYLTEKQERALDELVTETLLSLK